MARIRTIKPEFWSSEQIVECSPTARLLFVGMWNFCDDGGVIPSGIKTIKMQVFPGDDFTVNQIEVWLNELINNDLLKCFKSGDKLYYKVTGWHHQKIDKPSLKYPQFDNNSTTIRLPFDEQTPAEKEGKGKGREKEGKVEEKEVYPFDDFWNIYDKKVDRQSAERKYAKLSTSEKELIFRTLPGYVKSTPDPKYRKNPDTYLNNKSWNDQQIVEKCVPGGMTFDQMIKSAML